MTSNVLVAYEMNDASLTPEHGFPVRLVVPGFYGTNSVKWLTRLTLAEARALGPFTTRWYNDPVVQNGSESPTRLTAPVWSIAPQSLIVSPAPNATTGFSEEIEIWGWAWADGGVQAVDVAVDGGKMCIRDRLRPNICSSILRMGHVRQIAQSKIQMDHL